MAEDKHSAGAAAALNRRISAAFDVFDHETNHTVDVREIGTIIRSLGCFPTEAELHDIIAEIEEEEASGFIRFEKFLPVMTKILMENKFRPIPEDLLLQAFEVLDQQKNGYLEPEELTKYLTQEEVCSWGQLLQQQQQQRGDSQRENSGEPEPGVNDSRSSDTPEPEVEGEPFSQEEMDEMLSAALDPDKQLVFYREFVGTMTLDDPR